ncbi:amidohydrolase family protein [Streptomyces griseorubiginosus]
MTGRLLAPASNATVGRTRARRRLSEDRVEVALASDMFTQMRALHAIQRMRVVNAAYGTDQQPCRITTHDVLDFATLHGDHTNGLAAVTGSLTPGKKADLLVIQAEDLNNMPLNDPIGTGVLGSDARNISAVLINGEPRKWGGHVLDVDLSALRAEVHTSREYALNTPTA